MILKGLFFKVIKSRVCVVNGLKMDRKRSLNENHPLFYNLSAFDIWGMPIPGVYTTYGGGGYLASFDVNLNNSIRILNELFYQNWMDRQTRAIFLEFTLFCAATNLFIYNVFLVEFPQTGGAFKTVTIYPMRVYNHTGATGVLTIVCEVIFVIYVAVLLCKVCVRIYQQRFAFLKHFWYMYDLVILILALIAIVVYFIRLGFTNKTVHDFREDHKLFVNFSHIVLWDQILVAVLGFLVFLATLRILEVFGTAKKVQAVINIFKKCGRDLVSFAVMFFFIFTGFCFLGHLLFGAQLESYKNLYRTMGSLFVLVFGVTRYGEITETQPVLAKVFFIMFVISVIFFVLTIFMSILGGSIDEAVRESKEEKRQDIIEFMMEKFKNLIMKPSSKSNDSVINEEDEEIKKRKGKKKKKREGNSAISSIIAHERQTETSEGFQLLRFLEDRI